MWNSTENFVNILWNVAGNQWYISMIYDISVLYEHSIKNEWMIFRMLILRNSEVRVREECERRASIDC